MIYMFLAEGFEEIEALGTLDILRRAEISVETVGVESTSVKGSHGITVSADIDISGISIEACTGVILPGGMPGTLNLENCVEVQKFIDYAFSEDLPLAAICAAPSILGHKGFLKGRIATAFPGFEKDLLGAEVSSLPAVRDGNIITGKGAGAVFDFGLKIVEYLKTPEEANALRKSMQCSI